MAENTGGVLAAMVVGDRSHLTSTLRSAYRGAGLSHVLVVSGLHVTIFCGLLDALPHRERERSRAYRRARSLLRAGTALLLVGITGATPSVLRAAVAVWVSSLGVWVGGPADTLTSLGAAGVLMCLGNGYAVYDVGFELSFAAVMGTLAGAECAGRGRERYYDRKKKWKSRREETAPRSAPLPALCGRRVGLALRLPLCLGGDLPGAGAAGDEHDGLGCGVGRGRPLAGGADAELRPRSQLCWVWRPRISNPCLCLTSSAARRPSVPKGWHG
ncbi:MAG: ComEC/Rec2 family competence protein [Faecalibacterium prausnitzii]